MRGRKSVVERMTETREQYWPNSKGKIWKGSDETGYFCPPRYLPILMLMLDDKRLVGKLNCGQVYLELFSRANESGLVEIESEAKHAFHCGYQGNRAVRTWKERMKMLVGLGTIEVKGISGQDFTFVLITHPHIWVEKCIWHVEDLYDAYKRIFDKCKASTPPEEESKPKVESKPPLRMVAKKLSPKVV